MSGTQVFGAIVVVASAALFFLAVWSARRHRWDRRILPLLSAVCGVALIAMVLTDWPGEQLSLFWADHSILATVVSTVLLVSLGYVAFEAADKAEQEELNESVTSAGLSGLVDHLIDIDIALAMIAHEHPPAEYEREGRPLRWLRPVREELQASGSPSAPVSGAEMPGHLQPAPWRLDIIDQCVRRIIAGMRDWAALVSVSNDGRRILKQFGQLRIDLLLLQEGINDRKPDASKIISGLRKRFQRFAIGLEYASSPSHQRQGLTNFFHGGLSASETADVVRRLDQMSPPTVSKFISLVEKTTD